MTTAETLKPSTIPFFKVTDRVPGDDLLARLDDAMLTFLEKAQLSVENDGIGPYEFWGMKGVDRGRDYPVYDDHPLVMVEVWPLKPDESPDELRVTLDHPLGPVKIHVRYEALTRWGATGFVLAHISQEDY